VQEISRHFLSLLRENNKKEARYNIYLTLITSKKPYRFPVGFLVFYTFGTVIVI
jgi:hypothetical protein